MVGYRKLIFASVVFAAATALTACRILSGSEWVTAATLCLGAYTVGNVASKYSPFAGPGTEPEPK